MSLYDRIFKPHVYTLADGTAVEEKRSRAPLILLVLIADRPFRPHHGL